MADDATAVLPECPPGTVYAVERGDTGSLRQHPAVVAAFTKGADRVLVADSRLTLALYEKFTP